MYHPNTCHCTVIKGSLNGTHFERLKQCKCMGRLRDFPFKMLHEVWVGVTASPTNGLEQCSKPWLDVWYRGSYYPIIWGWSQYKDPINQAGFQWNVTGGFWANCSLFDPLVIGLTFKELFPVLQDLRGTGNGWLQVVGKFFHFPTKKQKGCYRLAGKNGRELLSMEEMLRLVVNSMIFQGFIHVRWFFGGVLNHQPYGTGGYLTYLHNR